MKKTKHVIVRITETQFKLLADALITEQKNKSEITRDALERYLNPAGKRNEKKNQKDNKNQRQLYEIPERIPMQEKYINLDVEAVFPAGEFTPEEVEFVEHFLDKLGVDLESEVKIKYFLTPSQLIHLLTGVKREYDGFLGLDGKIDGKRETQAPGETGYTIQSAPISVASV